MSSSKRPNTAAPAVDDNGSRNRGVDLVQPERSSHPHLPHERDESTGATAGTPSDQVRQGYRDLERGRRSASAASRHPPSRQRISSCFSA